MGPLPSALAFLLCSLAAAQRVEKVELDVQPPGGRWSAPELRTPQSPALLPLSQLGAPSLTPTPGLLPAPLATARPETVSALAPAARVVPRALAVDPVKRSPLDDFQAPVKDEKGAVRSGDGEEVEAGRRRFDGADDAAAADVLPDWPGEPGARVRLAGREYVLGALLGEGTGAKVYRVAGRPDLVVKLVNPSLKDASAYGHEVEDASRLEKGAVSQSRVLASGKDGLVLLKEFVDGPTAKELLDAGGLGEEQAAALGRFAARLVKAGLSADLKPANLVWEAARERWTLIDSGGARADKPEDVLGYFFIEDWRGKPFAGAPFLSAVRSALGAGSAAWRELAIYGPDDPLLGPAFAALAEADAARPPERLPDHPAPGKTVVIDGTAYVLGAQIGRGQGSNGAVFRVKDRPGLIVKFPIGDGKANAREAENLRLLDAKSTAHTRLVAASADGTVLVKTFARGETAKTILDRGPLSARQLSALAVFAAGLVRDGISPDVKPANLVWDAAGGRWILIDGGNLGPAGREEIIEWMLHPSQLPGHPSVDREAFLKELRALLQ